MKIHKIGWLNVPGFVPESWNPIVGCSKVSEGCEHCYAERLARRLASMETAGYTDTTGHPCLLEWKTMKRLGPVAQVVALVLFVAALGVDVLVFNALVEPQKPVRELNGYRLVCAGGEIRTVYTARPVGTGLVLSVEYLDEVSDWMEGGVK